MAGIYKCKSVGEMKEGPYGPYRLVETVCGKRFNCFEPGIGELAAGMEFTCELEQKGKYTNVTKGTFAINKSGVSAMPTAASAKPAPRTPPIQPKVGGPAPALPDNPPGATSDYMSKQDWAEKDRQKEANIARMNALTNLTNLAVAGRLSDDDTNCLIEVLLQNAGMVDDTGL